ncbi:MAG: helix-turn-helix domain-containing protein [Polyangia bacterium]|jgi:transcriptional regulator GlxA family with amidase domain
MRKQRIAQMMTAMFESDPSLTAKELSPRFGLTGRHLARVFKQERGISIVAYRNQLRFARFFALVSNQGERPQTLAEAARIAGFGTYPHFRRLFRARWHKRPREMVGDGAKLAVPPEFDRP